MIAHLRPGILSIASTEARRLEALRSYSVVQSEADPAFDEIVATLAALSREPMCCVSLLGEHYVCFNAHFGLDIARVARGEGNLCLHTIESHNIVAILDLSAHPDFQTNPLVCGDFGLRFYAGALLLARTGEAIGTICVVVTKPRARLGNPHRTLLQLFARTVIGHLELRKQSLQLHRLATTDRIFADAMDRTDEAIIITDATRQGPGPTTVHANAAFTNMMGYISEEIVGNPPRILRVERTDPAVSQRLDTAPLADESFEGETLKFKKDSSALLVNWKVLPVCDEFGQVTNSVGISLDETRA